MAKYYCVLFDADNTPVSYTHLDVYKRQVHQSAVRAISIEGADDHVSKRCNNDAAEQPAEQQEQLAARLADILFNQHTHGCLLYTSAMNTAPQVVSPAGMLTEAAVLMALTMAIRRCTRAVKVTQMCIRDRCTPSYVLCRAAVTAISPVQRSFQLRSDNRRFRIGYSD